MSRGLDFGFDWRVLLNSASPIAQAPHCPPNAPVMRLTPILTVVGGVAGNSTLSKEDVEVRD